MTGEPSKRPANEFIPPSPLGVTRAVEMPVFRFGDFTLRPAIDTDLILATYWVSADPEHRLTTKPTFWIENTARANSFLLEDEEGPIFFFKIVDAADPGDEMMPIYIQFGPDDTARSRKRTMAGMVHGFAWLEKRLRAMGYKAVCFDSKSPRLIYFSQRRLGFVWDGRRLVRRIDGKAECKEAERAPQ